MQLDDITRIIELFDSTQTTKLHIQKGDFFLKLEKGFTPNKPTQASEPLITPQETFTPVISEATNKIIAHKQETPYTHNKGENITSPMVGTFYRSPSPGAPAYVNVGDKVKKGQTLAIIEAMKIMNEIEAEFDCQIIEILPSDGQPVEYGSPLFVVERF